MPKGINILKEVANESSSDSSCSIIFSVKFKMRYPLIG